MQKRFLVDVDQTLLSYSGPFTTWAAERGHHGKPGVKLGDVYKVDLFLGCARDLAVQLIDEFCADDEFGRLPAEPHAVEVLNALRQDGWSFVAITACPTNDFTMKARKDNLEAVFGFPWDEIHMTGVRQPKRHILLQYEPSIWVEDSYDHAVDGAEIGHRTFMIDHPYNRRDYHPLVTRVMDWRDIHSAVMEMAA